MPVSLDEAYADAPSAKGQATLSLDDVYGSAVPSPVLVQTEAEGESLAPGTQYRLPFMPPWQFRSAGDVAAARLKYWNELQGTKYSDPAVLQDHGPNQLLYGRALPDILRSPTPEGLAFFDSIPPETLGPELAYQRQRVGTLINSIRDAYGQADAANRKADEAEAHGDAVTAQALRDQAAGHEQRVQGIVGAIAGGGVNLAGMAAKMAAAESLPERLRNQAGNAAMGTVVKGLSLIPGMDGVAQRSYGVTFTQLADAANQLTAAEHAMNPWLGTAAQFAGGLADPVFIGAIKPVRAAIEAKYGVDAVKDVGLLEKIVRREALDVASGVPAATLVGAIHGAADSPDDRIGGAVKGAIDMNAAGVVMSPIANTLMRGLGRVWSKLRGPVPDRPLMDEAAMRDRLNPDNVPQGAVDPRQAMREAQQIPLEPDASPKTISIDDAYALAGPGEVSRPAVDAIPLEALPTIDLADQTQPTPKEPQGLSSEAELRGAMRTTEIGPDPHEALKAAEIAEARQRREAAELEHKRSQQIDRDLNRLYDFMDEAGVSAEDLKARYGDAVQQLADGVQRNNPVMVRDAAEKLNRAVQKLKRRNAPAVDAAAETDATEQAITEHPTAQRTPTADEPQRPSGGGDASVTPPDAESGDSAPKTVSLPDRGSIVEVDGKPMEVLSHPLDGGIRVQDADGNVRRVTEWKVSTPGGAGEAKLRAASPDKPQSSGGNDVTLGFGAGGAQAVVEKLGSILASGGKWTASHISDAARWMLHRYGDGITSAADALQRLVKTFGSSARRFASDVYEAYRGLLNQVKRGGIGAKGAVGDIGGIGLGKAVRNTTDAISGLGNNDYEPVRGFVNKLAGRELPTLHTASPEAATAGVQHASSEIAAPHIARHMAAEVLGPKFKDEAFARKVGAVLTEDNLRDIRNSFKQGAEDARASGDHDLAQTLDDMAGRVNTTIGRDFKTEADYQAALNDPEVKAAVDRHKKIVAPWMDEQFKQLQYIDPNAQLPTRGEKTGARINLLPVEDPEGSADVKPGGGGTGNLNNIKLQRSKFARQATGAANAYETDYNKIIENSVRQPWVQATKLRFFKALVESGNAVMGEPGGKPPKVKGEDAVPFKVRDAVNVMGDNGRLFPLKPAEVVWVRKSLAKDVRRVVNVDDLPTQSMAAKALNLIQIAGPTDLTFHVANILSAVANAPGAKSMLADIGRKIPGVNVVDAIARVVGKAIQINRDSHAIREALAELAKDGMLRGGDHSGWSGKLLEKIDKAGRLVMSDMYDNLVQRGLAKDTTEGRRLFVNQLGQYNARLQGEVMRWMKAKGWSPFVVAGTTFNRLGVRALTGSPAVEAPTPRAAAKLRATQLLGGLLGVFGTAAAINYAAHGKLSIPGVPLTGVYLGKKDTQGRPAYVDIGKYTGLSRGMRLTGATAAVEGLRAGDRPAKIVDNAVLDSIGSMLHPWTGPVLRAGLAAGFGKDTSMRDLTTKDERTKYGRTMANILAAVKQVNPTVEGAIEGNTEGGLSGAAKGAAKSVLGAAGVKSGRDVFKDNLARVLDAHDQLQLAIKAKDADQVKALAADPMASKKLAEAAQKTETFINKLKAKVADPKTTDADRVVAQKQIQQLKDRFNEAVDRVRTAKQKK